MEVMSRLSGNQYCLSVDREEARSGRGSVSKESDALCFERDRREMLARSHSDKTGPVR
jgi:hypothetical protein